VSITSPQELEVLQAAGAVVRRVLEAMKSCVRPGITTGELDAVGALVSASKVGAPPPMVYGFPGTNLMSVNDEAVHGTRATGSCRTATW